MMNRNSPGRPRRFDERVALDDAMHAFWARGYHGTSYDDLERATGLRRQSLIYAFGDKRRMFARVLGHYVDARVGAVAAMLDDETAPVSERLAMALGQWMRDARADDRRGCLVVNSAGELGGHDPLLDDAIERATDKLRGAFARCFRTGQSQGVIRGDIDAGTLAELAVAAGDGAMLHSRVASDADGATRVLTALLRLVEPK